MAMTSEERLQTVIRCEEPDQVPVAPMIYYFAAYYAGITVHELWSDWKKYEMAIQKCFNELGPWDVYYNICPTSPETYQASLLMKVKYPGVDLPPDEICQFYEYEMMTPEDYDWIINYKGLDFRFLFDYRLHIMSRFMPGFKEDLRSQARLLYRLLENVVKWTIYIVEGQPMEPAFGVFQQVWGRRPNPPAITLVYVSGLADPDFLLEMDAVAVVPVE